MTMMTMMMKPRGSQVSARNSCAFLWVFVVGGWGGFLCLRQSRCHGRPGGCNGRSRSSCRAATPHDHGNDPPSADSLLPKGPPPPVPRHPVARAPSAEPCQHAFDDDSQDLARQWPIAEVCEGDRRLYAHVQGPHLPKGRFTADTSSASVEYWRWRWRWRWWWRWRWRWGRGAGEVGGGGGGGGGSGSGGSGGGGVVEAVGW